ncbi:unnamed protein product [Paramecium sonneborni]|uniref:F-BAR domain-containing protein n=1 Tax=Paramecium sonneborni TaxID=65129 RepID=A0A8S1PUR0_9CILI|nr:unnamed protein product [Paramecium sonneborni]
MNQKEKLAYFPNLLGQSDKVMSQNIDSKKGLEEYLAIMQERANVEQQYVKALNRLQSQIDKSNIILMKEQLINQLQNKIERIESFVEFIRTELQDQVKETLNQQNLISNKIIEEIKQMEQTLNEKKEKVLITRSDYNIKYKDVEQSGILDVVYQYSLDVSEDQTIKQICRTQQISIECSKLEKQYQLSIVAYNEFLDVYKTKMESYLIQMEEFEQTKLLVHKDTLLKMFLFEVSMSKHQFQEFEKLNEQIRNINIQDVIENFIMKYNRPDFIPEQMEFKHNTTLLLKKIECLKSQEYQKLKNLIKANTDKFYTLFSEIVEKNNQQTIENQDLVSLINSNNCQAYFKIFLIHINSIWNGGQFSNDQTIIDLLEQSSQNKILWLIALDIQAEKNNYRIPNSQAYDQIIKLSQLIISQCSQQMDITPLRQLIVLSSLIHILISNKKHYLMQSMKNNQIFTTTDFIEASIIEAIYDGLVEEVKDETNSVEKIKRQKINFFTQISKICFALLIFNKNDIIKNYAENYLKLLRLASNAIRDLTFQIESYQKL